MYGIFSKYLPTDQKIQTVANAAVLIFWVARVDSNDKRRFVGGRIFHSVALRPACILVVIRTALTLVLIYSDSPRLKFAACAENAGFYIQKCTVCDFTIAKSAQISDVTYTGKFCNADLHLIFFAFIKYNYFSN